MKIGLFAFSLFIGLTSCNSVEFDQKVGFIRAMWFEKPESQITIAWNSFQRSKISTRKIYYDSIDHGEDFSAYRHQEKLAKNNEYKEMDNSFVELKNLQANTKYFFLIKDGELLTRKYWFKTAPKNHSDLIFVAGGDSRNNRDVRTLANRLVAKLKPDAVMFGGDFTDRGSKNQWKKWFADWQHTIDSTGRVTPIIPTRGNHEKSSDMLSKLFNMPAKNYYSISFAQDYLKILTLDTNSSTAGNQKLWLEEELKNARPYRYRLAQYHRPMRPHVRSKKEGTHYKDWANLFYDYHVNLVVESDSHTVKETYPLRPSVSKRAVEGFEIDKENGTVYLGEGCWGAPLRRNNDDKAWTKRSGSFNQFKWIKLTEKNIEYKTVIIDDYILELDDTNKDRLFLGEEIQTWEKPSSKLVGN